MGKIGSNIRLTKQEFADRSNIIHNYFYDYSKVNYIDTGTNVIITCPIHGDFEQSPNNHLAKHRCPKCSGRFSLTQDEFIDKANVVHDYKYDYSKVDYKIKDVKVIIICPTHGEFIQSPSKHLAGQGCSRCIRSDKITLGCFLNRANTIHKNRYDYSKVKFVDMSTKIIIICPIHGEFEKNPHNHLRHQGCSKCSGKKISNEMFADKANAIHKNRYNYSKVNYKNNFTNIIIICKKHGDFLQSPVSHLRGANCPRCQNKYKETAWITSFNNPNILLNQVIHIGSKRYYPDGLDLTTNTVYEFNGDYWHGNPIKFKPNDIHPTKKITYGEVYRQTLQKEQELISGGYNVISIWESDFKINLNINKSI